MGQYLSNWHGSLGFQLSGLFWNQKFTGIKNLKKFFILTISDGKFTGMVRLLRECRSIGVEQKKKKEKKETQSIRIEHQKRRKQKLKCIFIKKKKTKIEMYINRNIDDRV